MSHVDFKNRPCRPVDFRGLGPSTYNGEKCLVIVDRPAAAEEGDDHDENTPRDEQVRRHLDDRRVRDGGHEVTIYRQPYSHAHDHTADQLGVQRGKGNRS